jgi:hypothetical protein
MQVAALPSIAYMAIWIGYNSLVGFFEEKVIEMHIKLTSSTNNITLSSNCPVFPEKAKI